MAPTVSALRSQAAEVVDAELLRLSTRLPDLDARARAEIARTVHRVVDKLLHEPTVRVKELAARAGRHRLRRRAARPVRAGHRRRRSTTTLAEAVTVDPELHAGEAVVTAGHARPRPCGWAPAASALARTQSQAVADAITAATGTPVELVHIVTEGDRSSAAIAQLGGTGVFVAAIRRALLEGSVDLAVHSYKDLPTAPEPGLIIAAVPGREDPRDALVARDGLTLGELPPGSTVGTGAPRRVAQLRALGLGLDDRPDPRQRRHPHGPGRRRATSTPSSSPARGWPGWAGSTRSPRPSTRCRCCPAPAQGALAVECRTSDARTRELLGRLEDPAARACVVAERSTLAALEAGCSAPVAAYAEVAEGEHGPELFLRASVTAIDGSDAVRGSVTGPPAGGRRPRARPGRPNSSTAARPSSWRSAR